jgi:hypothetical protein
MVRTIVLFFKIQKIFRPQRAKCQITEKISAGKQGEPAANRSKKLDAGERSKPAAN